VKDWRKGKAWKLFLVASWGFIGDEGALRLGKRDPKRGVLVLRPWRIKVGRGPYKGGQRWTRKPGGLEHLDLRTSHC